MEWNKIAYEVRNAWLSVLEPFPPFLRLLVIVVALAAFVWVVVPNARPSSIWRAALNFLQNVPFRTEMLVILLLSGVILLLLKSYFSVFGGLEYTVLVVVLLVATANFDLVRKEMISIYGEDNGNTHWKNTKVRMVSNICIGIFGLALIALILNAAFFYIFLLALLYVLYCYSNGNTMRVALDNVTTGNAATTRRYYSFLASTLAVAREENWPALLGYVILFFTMATVYVLNQFQLIEVDIQKEVKAYIAGAATIHLGISSIKFYRSMRYTDERNLGDRDTIDLIILGHKVSARTMQRVVAVAGQFSAAIDRRVTVLAGIAAACFLTTLVL